MVAIRELPTTFLDADEVDPARLFLPDDPVEEAVQAWLDDPAYEVGAFLIGLLGVPREAD